MISVIVPIYNVEMFLSACLESILASTYKDFEVILVDDGSIDGSGLICDKYAANETRVRVIHKSNAGVSEARNSGLRAAKGDYIMFVDGDDVIHPRMMEVLVEAIESGDYDFAMINGVRVKEDEYQERISNQNIDTSSRRVVNQSYCIRRLLDVSRAAFQYHVLWNKLIKRSLVDGIYFKKTGGEDFEWNNRMFLRTRQGIIVDTELYYYIQHGDSMTHSGVNPTYIDRIRSYYLCLQEMPKDKPTYEAQCLKAMYSMLLGVRYAAKNTEYYPEAKQCASEIYKKTKDQLMKSELSGMRKLRFLCFYHAPWLYSFVIKFMYGFLRR